MPDHKKNIFFYKFFFRINKGDIEAEFGRQVKKIGGAKADTLKQEDLKAQMEGFLKVRNASVLELSPVCVNFDGNSV